MGNAVNQTKTMRNSKELTQEINKTLNEAISIVRNEVSFESLNLLSEAMDVAERAKNKGSFSYRALSSLSDTIFTASIVLKRSEAELMSKSYGYEG